MPKTILTIPTMPEWMNGILLWLGIGFLLIMGALCLLLLVKMWKNEINLSTLLEGENGNASIARFQLLVFSLVVAVGIFLYILEYKNLPDIPPSVLTLLGISASTYATGKGIQFSRPEGLMQKGTIPPPVVPPGAEPQPPVIAPPQPPEN